MTDDHDALARAAGSLRRAAKAAEALDRDPLAARLLHGAVRAAEVELARLRQDADNVGAWEPTFKLDACENLVTSRSVV